MTHANPSSRAAAGCGSALAAVLVATLRRRRLPGVAVARRPQGRRRTSPRRSGSTRATRSASSAYRSARSTRSSPAATDVKITMTVQDGVKVPADAKALDHRAEPGVGPLRSAHPGLHRRPGDGRRCGDRPRPHRGAGRMGRGQGAADPAQRPAGPAAGIGAGPADRVRQPGRRHLRRQRGLVPAGAARTVADRGPARRFAHRPVRHHPQSAGARQRAVQQQRADRAVLQPRRLGVAGAGRQLDRPRQHPGHAQPGAVRRQGISEREQRGADRPDRQAGRFHPDPRPTTATTSSRSCTSRPTVWRTSTTSTTRPRARSAAC